MNQVSVVIAAYNKAEYTRRTVDSVLAQTYPHLEVIVVDDGSTDHTPQAMAAYGDRIKYIRKTNGGACSARNAGIRHARGSYIALLDCDDLYVPEKIEICVRYLDDHPQTGFVHTAAYFVDADDQVLSRYSHPQSRRSSGVVRRLILKNFICNSTVVARKSCIERAGLFDETIFVSADWDLWLRLAQTAEAGYIDVPLTKYRVTDNYTFNKITQSQAEEKVVIEKFFRRNPRLEGLRRAALCAWHLRFAQCYFLKEDRVRFRALLWKALAVDPVNVYAWTQALCFLCAPWHCRNVLHKKIIRQDKREAARHGQ